MPILTEDIKDITAEGGRFYPVNGNMYPSITSVLSTDKEAQDKLTYFWEDRILRTVLAEKLGLPEMIPFKEFTDAMKAEHKELIESLEDEVQACKALEQQYTAERGERLHKLIENYLLEQTLPEEISIESTLFDLMKTDLDRITNVRLVEKVLVSEQLEIAGRVDIIADFDQVLSVIDAKGSTKLKRKSDRIKWWLQTCFYAVAYEESTGEHIPQLVVINGREDGICAVYIEQVADWYPLLLEAIEKYKELRKAESEGFPG